MLQKVQKKMEELNMVFAGDLLVVGVSGGADSVCLLVLLEKLRKEMEFELEAVHVEHGIRGKESLEDATFVEELCKCLQVPLEKVTVDVPAYSAETGMGTEESARVLRYQAFSRLAKEKGAKIALAHHMEDNAETILFQLARGSSLTGLCGMQPSRKGEDGVEYIRPLLSFSRTDIEVFLKTCNQAYRTDATNVDTEYSRNYLRSEVLPQLVHINEKAVQHINETAGSLSEIRDYLDEEVARAWADIVEETDKQISIDCKKLEKLHLAVQKELIYLGIAKAVGGKKDITSIHVENVRALLENQSGREATLPKGVSAKKEFDKIIFGTSSIKEEKEAVTVSESMLEEARKKGESLEIPFGNQGEKLVIRVFSYNGKSAEIPKKTYTKWMDYDKIKAGFCIRNRISGDYFIGDDFGHHKKLKQYFIDEKISATERENMWLLAQGQLVLWLIGGRDSSHLKLIDETKTVVEIVYEGGH